MTPNYTYKAKILRVIDGDTIEAELDIGFCLTFRTKLRLLGVNSPEIHAKDEAIRKKAQESRNFTEKTLLDQEVFITTSKFDAFGRYLATVFVKTYEGTWVDFNKILLDGGYAIVFKG